MVLKRRRKQKCNHIFYTEKIQVDNVGKARDTKYDFLKKKIEENKTVEERRKNHHIRVYTHIYILYTQICIHKYIYIYIYVNTETIYFIYKNVHMYENSG